MLAFVRIYLFLFGLLAVGGGLMGYVKAKSKPSIIAGSIAGGLLWAAGYLVGTENAQVGWILGLVVSIALAGRFVPAFLKTKKMMPAGMMAALSVICAALIAIVLVQK